MKKIECIIRAERLKEVTDALKKHNGSVLRPEFLKKGVNFFCSNLIN